MPRMKAIAAAILASFGDVAHRHLSSFMGRQGLVRYVDDPAAAPAAALQQVRLPPALPLHQRLPLPPLPRRTKRPRRREARRQHRGRREAAAAAAAAPVTLDDAKAFLTAKGVKAEDLAKLDEAGIRAKHAELKAAEAKKPGAIDPKSIEIKLPEGFNSMKRSSNSFREILADANLSPQERGQKLVDHARSGDDGRCEAAHTTLWNKTQADWQAEVKADKEIGGQNWKATERRSRASWTVRRSQGTPEGKGDARSLQLHRRGQPPRDRAPHGEYFEATSPKAVLSRAHPPEAPLRRCSAEGDVSHSGETPK
jgi:hypothetical protein